MGDTITSDPAPDDAPVAEPAGEVIDVLAIDNSFRAETIEISAGDEVRWENRGQNEHNIVPVDPAAWGIDTDSFQPGDVYEYTFLEPGEYPYYCSIHGNETVGMTGTIVVTDER